LICDKLDGEIKGAAPMSQTPRAPSVLKILWSDQLACLGVIGPLVTWGLYTATLFGVQFRSRSGNVSDGGDSPLFMKIAIVATVVLLPLVAYRVWSFASIFRRGNVVTGRIDDVSFTGDRGTVSYIYTYEGKEYFDLRSIMKNATTSSYQKGQEIEVIVDSVKPSRAVIVELYS
jgi:hypothetical protein